MEGNKKNKSKKKEFSNYIRKLPSERMLVMHVKCIDLTPTGRY
jgi:hypothetical protein